MKIKSLIIVLLITLLTSFVFAQNEVNFYPIDVDVENTNMKIHLGASRGWESISISDKNTYKYISLCKIDKNIYAYTKDEKTGIYKWEIVSDTLINSLAVESFDKKTEQLVNRIFTELSYKSVSVSLKNDKEQIEKYLTEKSYVPFYFEVPENSKYDIFYSIAIEDYKAKHIIYGNLNSNSRVYNFEKKPTFALIEDNKSEYNNICAFSLKELSNNTIPTLGNTENLSYILKIYLEDLYENQYPVFGSKYITNAIGGSFDNYYEIGEDEGKEIALAAKRYLNWAVEYDLGSEKYDVPLRDDVDNLWGTENPEYSYNYWPKEKKEVTFPTERKGIAGNPIPYVKGGIDTPRTFWKKMQLSDNKLKILNKEFSYNVGPNISFYKFTTYKSFQPGIGSDVFKYAGTDSLGFFTGVISMTKFQSEIKGINGIKSAENLNIYSKNVEELITSDNYKDYKSKLPVKLIKHIYNTDNVTFSWDDINFITEIVPTFKDIREGDFLISDNNGNGSIAVVINKNSNNSIDIIFINEKMYGTAKSINISSLIDYTARRLLIYKKDESKNKIVSDVLDKTPDIKTSKISISNKYEATQTNKTENWRFIPNTGEYLILDGINVNLRNSSNVDLLKLYGVDAYKLKICAKDRDYKEGDNSGNINNNYAKKFEVAIIGSNGNINKKESYKQKYVINAKEVELTIGESKVKENQYNSESLLLISLTDSGSLVYKKNNNTTGESVSVGIRPESSAKAFPGDDLIIGFDVYCSTSGGLKKSSKIWSKPQDYVAVYDKKMLWRANLFLEQKESELGDMDWNDVHPWNVPPSGENGPVWWNKDTWGNNTWNRKYDFNKISDSFNLDSLEPGDGTQNNIKIPNTKWFYGMKRNENNHEFPNKQTTAYDYQGWDNPFSFVAKIDNQKKLIAEWYNTNGNKYGEPKYLWQPLHKNTNANSAEILNQMRSCLGECISENDSDDTVKEIYKTEFESKGYESVSLDNINYHKMVFSSDYQSNKAPFNQDGLFVTNGVIINKPTNTSDEAVVLSGKKYFPYIPGLSDSISNTNHPSISENMSKRVAGVDCIGFVQRSASWPNNIYSAITETKTDEQPVPSWLESKIPTTQMKNFYSSSYAYNILNRGSMDALNGIYDSDENNVFAYTKIKYIVPGDILYYPTGSNHIMMVNSIGEPSGYEFDDSGAIDYNKPYWETVNTIKILESVYHKGNNMFGVGKKRDLGYFEPNKNNKLWQIWRQK